MSFMFALLLAATPTAAPAEAAPAKKPRMRCEWIHEVGTSRPRRVCEKPAAPKPAETAQPAETVEKAGEKQAGSSDK